MALVHAAVARGRARHAAAALLPSVRCYLPWHTRPFLSAASSSRKEATAAASVLPELPPPSHWKGFLSRSETSILGPTEAAAQELVDAIGQERFNGGTVVNFNAGPGNFARFLYHNTDTRVVCVNFCTRFQKELQKMCDLSGGRISSSIAPIFDYLNGLACPLDSALGHLAQRPWSADPPPLLVLGSMLAPSFVSTCFTCIDLITERSGIWSYGRVPLHVIVPDVNGLHSTKGDHDAIRWQRSVLPVRLLSHIADISVRPISAAFHKIGRCTTYQNMYLLTVEPKPITVVPPGASTALRHVVKSLNRSPAKPLAVAIKTLAAGAEDILSDFSSSPGVKVIDLTVAQLVELTRLYDCWPFRPQLPRAWDE